MNYYDKGLTGYYRDYRMEVKPLTPKHGMPTPFMDGIPQKPFTVPKQGRLNLFPLDEGFYKGTIFRDLYKPYKNYQPRPVVPTNDRERLLHEVNKYYFALHEIRMYLNAYPNDEEAIRYFTEFQEGYIRAKHEYETKYDALDIEAPNLNTSPWNWTVGRWPWVGGM